MIIAKLIVGGVPFLLKLFENGIKPNDLKYLELIKDYAELAEKGYKKTYLLAHLAEAHNLSENTVYQIIKRVEKDI